VKVYLNKVEFHFTREMNPYRLGAARISMVDFASGLSEREDMLEISIG
jgi:hypothetical protein